MQVLKLVLFYFALAIICCDLWARLPATARPMRSKIKTNRDLLAQNVPALGVSYMHLLRVVIGSLLFGFGFMTFKIFSLAFPKLRRLEQMNRLTTRNAVPP